MATKGGTAVRKAKKSRKFCLNDFAIYGPEAMAAVLAERERATREQHAMASELTESMLMEAMPMGSSPRSPVLFELGVMRQILFKLLEPTAEDKRTRRKFEQLRPVFKKWGHKIITVNKWYDFPPRVCRELRELAELYGLEDARPLLNGALYKGHKATGAHNKTRLSEGIQPHHLKAIRQHIEGLQQLPMIRCIDDLPPTDQKDYEMNEEGVLQRTLIGRRKAAQSMAIRCQISGTGVNTLNGGLKGLADHFTSSQVLVLKASTILRTAIPNALFVKVPASSLFQHAVVPFRYGRTSSWHMAIKCIDSEEETLIIHIVDACPSLPQWFTTTKMPQPFQAQPIAGTDSITSVLHYMEVFLSAPQQFIDNMREIRSPDYGITISNRNSKSEGADETTESTAQADGDDVEEA